MRGQPVTGTGEGTSQMRTGEQMPRDRRGASPPGSRAKPRGQGGPHCAGRRGHSLALTFSIQWSVERPWKHWEQFLKPPAV